jgi:hypothetical protein
MTFYRDTIKFDSIVVIESLKPKDSKTGEWLYDRVIDSWARRNGPFHTRFYQVVSRQEFFAVLDTIRAELFQNGHAPILHIEAHGDTKGLELGNGDYIQWEELRDRLTEMNRLCNVNLLVVMAMCAGWHLSRLLMPTDRAPVWGIVGPTEDVKAGPMRESMETFYNTLLDTMDARRALDEMNDGAPYGAWTYILETAEIMFCRVFHHYVHKLCTEDQLQERENEIVAEFVRRRDGDLTVAFEGRQMARRMLRQHSELFDYYKRSFFFLGVPTVDASRFQLTFDDCANLPEPAT